MPVRGDHSPSPHRWCATCGARPAEHRSDICRLCRRSPAPEASEAEPCRCTRCGRPCGACTCPSPPQPQADVDRYRDPARRRAYQTGRKAAQAAERKAAGVCVTCGCRPADNWRTRCGRCHQRAVRTGWIARQRRRELDRAACSHGHDRARDCPACRTCIDARVRADAAARWPTPET